jgi:hypothetical protein
MISSPIAVSRLPRFVGENERRVGHHRSSDGYALLLPSGELARSVLLAAGETYEREHLLRTRRRPCAHATVDQRQLDVLERRRAIQQIESLEDEADVVARSNARCSRGNSATSTP